jgi:hypothetical protein
VLALKLARDQLAADPEVDVVLIAGGYRNGDLIDLHDPNVRFMYNLGAGAGGAGGRARPRAPDRPGAHRHRRRFSLDVLVPVGGTVAPVTPRTSATTGCRCRPHGMKARLEELSLANFVTVVREAVRKAGATMDDVAYLAMLHVKPSAHAHLLRTLGIDAGALDLPRRLRPPGPGRPGALARARGAARPAATGRPGGAGRRRRRLRLERHHPALGGAGSAGEDRRPGHRAGRGGAMTFDVAASAPRSRPTAPPSTGTAAGHYGAMDRRAARLAARLHALGVERFDRISILAHNHLAPRPVARRRRRRASSTRRSTRGSARWSCARGRHAAPAAAAPRRRARRGGRAAWACRRWRSRTTTPGSASRGAGRRPIPAVGPEDPQMILLTGGTTGLPKGAVLPYRQQAANAAATVLSWGLRDDDLAVQATPCFHAAMNALTTPLYTWGRASR